MADLLTDFANAKRNRKNGYQSQWANRGKSEHHKAKPYDVVNGEKVLTPLTLEEKKKLEEYTGRGYRKD